MAPFYECGSSARLEPLGGGSQVHSWNIHHSISKLTGKTEYAKHVVRNVSFSEAADQDNITGQTACEQVLYMGIHGIWEVGDMGIIHS